MFNNNIVVKINLVSHIYEKASEDSIIIKFTTSYASGTVLSIRINNMIVPQIV
jgi:hypothetical protein